MKREMRNEDAVSDLGERDFVGEAEFIAARVNREEMFYRGIPVRSFSNLATSEASRFRALARCGAVN
jgi:hypothetical protein